MLPLVATSEFSKIFTGELSALMERARSSLDALVQNPRDDAALADALAAYHSMGSMGGMAKAIGIEKVGRLFERLIDVASTFAISDPDQALAIFRTCQKHLPVLHEIIGVTLSGREEEGEAAAEQVRLQVFEDWGGYYYQPLPGMAASAPPPIVTKETPPAPLAAAPAPLPVPAPVRPEVDVPAAPAPAAASDLSDDAFDAFDAAVREAGLAGEPPRSGPFPLDVVMPTANLGGDGAPRPLAVPSPGLPATGPKSEDEEIADFLNTVGTPQPELAPPPEAPPLPLRAPIMAKETKRITTPRFEPVPPPVRTTRMPEGFTPVPTPSPAESGSRSSDGSLSFISAGKPTSGSLSGGGAPPPIAPVAAPQPAPEDAHVDREMLEFFIPETEEYCETMERAVEAWERNPADEQPPQTLMRLFHTIKGAANSIGLSHMGRLAHSMEDMFMGLDEKRFSVAHGEQLRLTAESVKVMRQCLRRATSTPPSFTAPAALEELIQQASRAMAGEAQAAAPAAEVAELQPSVAPTPVEVPVQLPFEPEGIPLEAPAEVAAAASEQSAVVAETVPQAGPVTTMVTAAPAEEDDETYSESQMAARIEPQRLDLLMNLIGELIVGRNQLQTRLSAFNSLQRELENAKNRLLDVVADFQEKYEYSPVGGMAGGTALPPGVGVGGGSVLARPRQASPPGSPGASTDAMPEGFSDLEFDRYDDLNILCRALVEIGNDANEVITQSGKFINSFNDETDRFSKTASRLQETITAVRLTPLESLFRRLTRVANQASNAEGKQVRFVTEGAATKLDRVVIDQIFQPLLHLVRNAVSHGIESDEVRAIRGKTPQGTVSLKASQRAGQVILELTDDGGGMDLAAIRQRGIERGFIDPNAEMNESQLINLIFQPGFSTARTVTDISGRGIGMDVVRREITRLNGSIEIRSRAGQGSTITLRVPVTLSVNQAAFVAVGGETYALAANFLERAVTVKKADIVRGADGQEMLPLDGGSVPFLRIDQLLDCPPALDALPSEDQHAVVVQLADEFFALGVDRSLGRQDIVVKGLGPILAGHPFFNGGTIGPDGRVVLLLDLPGISQQIFERSGRVALVRAQAASAPEPIAPAGVPGNDRRALAPILIVDDSLSIRKVAEKYVGELGFRTDTAADGAAALEKIKRNTYSLVMTDLEMPRMHGFDLLAAIRSHEPTKDLPVLVVTSRAAEKHRWQAKELGASDYVVKPFSKEQLAEKFDRYLNPSPVSG
ncbi:MAG: hybrid sensor histidine kinase/response regulator [Verrucomicrobia bacterium]|nr:hybrid sensor histidine kinase/response regulator [Verrucomicrobiota bacterium]